eukprot:1646959-Rhodomonas_salina.1
MKISIPAIDEDGTGRPISCRASSACTNVDMGWNMLGASSDGASLTLHSDALSETIAPAAWTIQRRDENAGGGITVTIQGPLQQPYVGTQFAGSTQVGSAVQRARNHCAYVISVNHFADVMSDMRCVAAPGNAVLPGAPCVLGSVPGPSGLRLYGPLVLQPDTDSADCKR